MNGIFRGTLIAYSAENYLLSFFSIDNHQNSFNSSGIIIIQEFSKVVSQLFEK